MDYLLSFYEKNSIYTDLYNDKYEALIRLKELLGLGDDVKIYISDFYEKDVNERIYIFDDKHAIQVFFGIKDSSLLVDYTVYKKDFIARVELKRDTGYKNETSLEIEFKNGKSFLLDNIEGYDNSTDEAVIDKKKDINSKLLEGLFRHLAV